jgi:hypothetical protein
MATYKFPQTGLGAEEVVTWMTFTHRPYSNKRADKVAGGGAIGDQLGGYGVGGGQARSSLAQITLPAPKSLVTNSVAKYEQNKTAESVFTEQVPFLSPGESSPTKRGFIQGFRDLFFADFVRDLFTGGLLGRIDMDRAETIFSQMNPRTFQFSFPMIAKSSSESFLIANIVNSFETFMLPVVDAVSTTRMRSPGFWQWYFWQEDNKSKRSKYVGGAWSSQAKTSVLTEVRVDKTPAGGAYSSAAGLPLAQTLNLVFVELEPNLRNLIGDGILSRSESLRSQDAEGLMGGNLFPFATEPLD